MNLTLFFGFWAVVLVVALFIVFRSVLLLRANQTEAKMLQDQIDKIELQIKHNEKIKKSFLAYYDDLHAAKGAYVIPSDLKITVTKPNGETKQVVTSKNPCADVYYSEMGGLYPPLQAIETEEKDAKMVEIFKDSLKKTSSSSIASMTYEDFVKAKEELEKHSPYLPSPVPHHYTGSPEMALSQLFDIHQDLDWRCGCNVDLYGKGSLSRYIQHLNDKHKWSRKKIADHIETIPGLDLKIKDPALLNKETR